jgi:hypothetical protein
MDVADGNEWKLTTEVYHLCSALKLRLSLKWSAPFIMPLRADTRPAVIICITARHTGGLFSCGEQEESVLNLKKHAIVLLISNHNFEAAQRYYLSRMLRKISMSKKSYHS